MRRVVVLGSTGSVGVSTLDLFDKAEAEVEVLALTGGCNAERLAEQARRWRPSLVVIADEAHYGDLKARLQGSGVEVAAGADAVRDAAAMGADWAMSAIVGSAGLAPTLAAARTGAVVALANKESLVCAGPALLRTAKAAGGPAMLEAISAPFAHLGTHFVPTGGVSLDNMHEWLKLGAVAAVGGTWIATKADISEGRWSDIAARPSPIPTGAWAPRSRWIRPP